MDNDNPRRSRCHFDHGAVEVERRQAINTMSMQSTPMQSRRASRDSYEDEGDESHDDERGVGCDVEQQAEKARAKQGPGDERTSSVEAQKEERQSDNKDNDDPLTLKGVEDPLNWSTTRKWCLTAMVSTTFLNTTLASSMATGATQFYVQGFGASFEVAVLILSCYMIGFAFGPLIWSPLSEILGRKLVFVISIPCFMLINIGCALSNDMATLLVLRVFAGFFGASPQSAAGATISDVFSPAQRPLPMLVYSCCAFGGPVIGPTIGGFLYVTDNWRWIYWLLAIFAGFNSILLVLFQRESYPPVLRRRKAKQLRAQGHPAERAPIEMHMSWKELFTVHLLRPFTMLFNVSELPLIYAAVWTGWAYALLFIFFEAYPVIFQGIYGFNAGQSGLCFVAFGIGIFLAIPIIVSFNNQTIRAVKQGGNVTPEARLRMVTFTAPLYVIGFFWFGWTSRKEIHWIVPVIATIPIGTSTILSFNALAVYVAQCYHIYAASALGAMAFSRCFIAIFVPLFGRQMFEGLGPGWAASILGFVSLIAIPIPFIFGRFGDRIRANAKWALSPIPQ